jgi:hypothetical protein
MQGINGDKQGDFGIWISDWGFNLNKVDEIILFWMHRIAKIVQICTIMILP